MNMKKIIAYCGINCSECPAYLATQTGNREELKKVANEWSTDSMSFTPEEIQCEGCNQNEKIFSWCGECPIRSCCRNKGYDNCAYCDEYVCDNLKMTFDKTSAAKDRLDEIRRNI
jgi:hypothetical protein